MRYRLQTGSFSWLVHRVTGVLLTLYIFLHLYVLSQLRDRAAYEAMMAIMRRPLIRLSEAGLLGLVIGHAVNGFRLTLIDAGVSTRLQKRLFWTGFFLGALLFIVGSAEMLGALR
jgi:succinate dehydrogenase / fumarate reductase cytochrome b subunit